MRVREYLAAILALTLLSGVGCQKRREPRTEYDWWQAAYEGDVQKAMDLIVRGVPPRLTRYQGQTPLHIAAERGHLEMVRFLVGCGPRIDTPDGQGHTPAMLAMAGNHRSIVEYLVEEGAALNLHLAAYLGDADRVNEFLAGGADVNLRGPNGWPPLHYAVVSNQADMAKLLIAAGADLNALAGRKGLAEDFVGGTALHHAVQQGDVGIVGLLIDSGADVEATNHYGITTLRWATWEGKAEMVKLLIAKGADASKHGESNHFLEDTPLAIAVRAGRIDIVEFLIAGGANVNATVESGWTVLHVAVTEYDKFRESRTPAVQMMGLLVAHGEDVKAGDEEGMTPLHCAAYKGHEDVVAFLLARGADVNARTVPDPRPEQIGSERDLGFRFAPGVTPLHEAVAGWDPNVVGLLLAHGAKVGASDESGNTSLHYAAARARRKVAEVLIAAGADVHARNKDGTTPLAIALRRGNVETARALIAAGAEKVVMKNDSPKILVEYESRQEPVLHLAIAGRSEMPQRQVPSDAEPNPAEFRREWIELLLANGADPNERDEEGNTALSVALLRGDEGVGRLLIGHGCDVHARNPGGTTALHLASAGGRGELISLLLAKGADVNAQDNDGDTPLHSAALRGHKEAVELLLSHKADPSLRNSRGRTPRDEAVRRGHTDVVQLLTAGGGRRDGAAQRTEPNAQ
ncbi:MAG TPA: ankyrin repeat domain-containing protein [Sedimentisphaerales bacterium]|nr:ankyrin repeat domain-containing protein [Sedimentisphaerales bacterium]